MGGIRKKDPSLKEKMTSFINDFYFDNRRSPYMSELAAGLGIAKSTAFRYVRELADEGSVAYDGTAITTSTIRKADGTVQFAPVVGRIACGGPNFAEEDFEEFVALPTALFGRGDFFVLRTFGDSMIEAGIEEGDTVVLKRQSTASEGDIVAFMNEEHETTLKRIHFDHKHGRVILHPENERMSDIVIRDPKDCVILGVACHVIKKL